MGQLDAILKRHLTGLNLFDIGARGGIHDRWTCLHPILNVIGFEPEKAECEALNKQAALLPYKARFLPYALGEKTDATVPFYVCKEPGCSSTYKPNAAFLKDFAFAPAMAVQSVGTMQTVSLSDVCRKEQTYPDMVKVDVQGAELDILKGGIDVLSRAKVMELEVEFNPQYEGQPLFHDVDRFMVRQGWRLLGLRRDYWRRAKGIDRTTTGSGGTLMHGDALYYNVAMLDQPVLPADDLLKFALIFAAYRQTDFVLSLFQRPALATALTSYEWTVLKARVIERPSMFAKLLHVALSGTSQRNKRRLMDALQRGDATDWHDADFF